MSVPYVLSISSEKGGVGKTTLAMNLAIYLKAHYEDLPVTLLSFDNHFSVDRMFQIGRQKLVGDVSLLFRDTNPDELVAVGEYGVQFIPSCSQLNILRRDIDDPSVLAKNLLKSSLGGILIIDTRPDLDIFTQNALFASDRVIVPVKDAPSLENCRNIYNFFDMKNLSRRALRILPCLVDGRIHYDGLFRDPYQLLKAYAINRGYRCLEGYIAKSPKVESLNTNPEGKIYPVLTHGRQTEVHRQLSEVAHQVYKDSEEKGSRRLEALRLALVQTAEQEQSDYEKRRNGLAKDCLACGTPLINGQQIHSAGYFVQRSDRGLTGFLEDECFNELIFHFFYGSKRKFDAEDSVLELFRESALHSYFVLCRTDEPSIGGGQSLSLFRFDNDGREASHKVIILQEPGKSPLFKESPALLTLLERTLLDVHSLNGRFFIMLRKVNCNSPEEILFEQNYAQFSSVMEKAARKIFHLENLST